MHTFDLFIYFMGGPGNQIHNPAVANAMLYQLRYTGPPIAKNVPYLCVNRLGCTKVCV
jgi:hypothetical protein